MTKFLIINADDFGLSRVFNQIIIDLISKDLIRSTTVMVDRIMGNQQEQCKALITLQKNKNISVGLHLEFQDHDYSSQIRLQYQKFVAIFGCYPSHIDIHKAHSFVDSFTDVATFCRQNDLPLRNSGLFHEGVQTTSTEAFFGSIADYKKIEAWTKTLQDGNYYEILFHPGKFDPRCRSSINKERERDVDHIKKLHTTLEKSSIKIVSYVDLVSTD